MIYKYEWIKFYRAKHLIVMILFLMLINGLNIYSKTFDGNGKLFNNGKDKINEQMSGKITQDKYDYMIEYHKKVTNIVDKGDIETVKADKNTYYTGYVFGDMQLFNEVIEKYNYCLNYPNYLDHIKKICLENIEMSNDPNVVSENKEIMKIYVNRAITSYYDFTMTKNYINHDFSSLLLMILIIIICVHIITKEKEDNTEIYFNLVNNGRNRAFRTKIVTLFTIVTIVALLFFIEDFIISYLLGANKGWLSYLYYIDSFKATPVNISVLLFAVIALGYKLLFCYLFTSIIIFITMLLKKGYQVLIGSLIFIVFSIFTYNNNLFSILSLVTIREYFYSHNNMYMPVLIVGILLIVLINIINKIVYTRRILS